MTTRPDQDDDATGADGGAPPEVPPATPAYATPPPGGIPDADDD
ncbi:hypothetical protein [Mycobacterium yunnanensis]|nr:hypothetical protein [Mycobacterium yunnanensis]